MGLYRAAGKRAADLIGAGLGLVTLSPVFVLAAVATWAALGRPILFRQRRGGLHGRPFALLKFRTMADARGADGAPLPDDERLTRFGRWLRRTSLDELPELWNVLRGEMSLVGPRPLMAEYLDRYSPDQARRHEVRPGVTGWAQVNGRNATTWPDRFRLDVWYVDHVSFLLDVRILLRTLGIVFRGHGVNAADHATMTVFRGER
jgi:lipopolysaccharide/colanic/teichoic acid biosynthesis glycosyltransferase